nr:immunoglobulin heavy chain junction region [Mus musculus]NSM04260.1 immunoglobulin heavy chain junction region [Mus musculus]NSM04947.1 immunoglobulin heavy chain junction region [Mus musculus]NSM04982.1 immunoglobulin heavy chain junction region [Mus musculus]NSM05399.1 immunoglobulin heavy chain junction region [Mus musculus]
CARYGGYDDYFDYW